MSKYDIFRKKLFYQDYQSLRSSIDSRNPFSSVPMLTKDEAQFLYDFLKPPTRETYLQDQRKRNSNGRRKQKKYSPHALIFIVDALTKLKHIYIYLQAYTQLKEHYAINPELLQLNSIANKAIPFFTELAKKHPTLSFENYLSSLRSVFPNLEYGVSDQQVKRAITGIHTTHPLYSCFIQPLIENPSQKKQEVLTRHQLINGIIWNTYLFNRYLLSPHQTIELALRSINENDLKDLKGFSELKFHVDLALLLKRALNPKFKEIISFLNRLDKTNRTRATDKKPNKQIRKHSPHQHNYWIETDDHTEIINIGEEEDGLLIIRKLPVLEAEITEDLAEDEFIEEEYIQEIPGEETSTPEAKVVSLAHKLKHLANFNQFLKDELTPSEITSILQYAEKKSQLKSTSESDLRSLMLILISLTTGYNLHQSHYLRWLKINPEHNSERPCISENCDTLYLPIPRYEYHKPLENNTKSLYYSADKFIVLPLPPMIQRTLLSSLNNYYKKSINSNDPISETSRQNSIKSSLSKVLTDIGLDNRITITMIQNNMPFKALKYANGDLWTISLFSGREDIMSATHKHYTTVDVLHAYRIYQKAVEEVFEFCLFIPEAINHKSFKGIGNPFRPQKHKVVSWLNQVADTLSKTVNIEPKLISTETLIHNMNLLTGYFETFASFFIATRNTTNPYIYSNQILPNGFLTLNDKNINDGYNTHLVYVPFQIRKLQSQYEFWMWKAVRVLKSRKFLNIEGLFSEKLKTVHKWKSTNKASYRFPGFFLIGYKHVPTPKDKKLKVIVTIKPYTRGNLHAILEQQTPSLAPPISLYEKNINRHFLRSSLLERAVNPEYIDEYMGHRHWGTESWNRFGLFNPVDYQDEMKQAIEIIMKDFKVRSPFKEER